ncbi:acyl-CoA dehydrogenase family protein [Arthrobacter sp. H-02-3]|uniref:acyl-CoA dehydrogenase family protein n=1 Tax=Arthrobacter sp. H-02-3 TaxID=2703675 RepID=UPI000DD22CA0|nr:acyl-CoA dehydrogenase family protein [Arthrobacter sp. H-02-3]PVZ53844.1 acyl-CoA dehydrogenase [Arthrobacter sp. H-02-3]
MTDTQQPIRRHEALNRTRSPRVVDLRDRFADVFERIAAGAADRDRERRHPFEEVRALANAGFTRLRVPEEHGGLDVSLPDFFELIADLGAADANVPNILRGHFSFVEILRQMPQGPERSHWFNEIGSGKIFGNGQTEPAPGPAAVPQASITRTQAGWTVRGTKIYSSGTLHADAVRTSVVGPDGDLYWAIVSTESPLVERLDDWDGFGQRLSASGTTLYHDAPVDDIGVFRLGPGTRQHQSFVQIIHLATLAGIARRIRDDAVQVLVRRTRTSMHGLNEQPRHDQLLLGVVGDLARRAVTADLLTSAAAERLEEANEHLGHDDEAETYSRCYLFTSQAQVQIIDDVSRAATRLFDLGGSSAVSAELNLDRHWRNARTLASHNPVVYKDSIVGDFIVNGTLPGSIWAQA